MNLHIRRKPSSRSATSANIKPFSIVLRATQTPAPKMYMSVYARKSPCLSNQVFCRVFFLFVFLISKPIPEKRKKKSVVDFPEFPCSLASICNPRKTISRSTANLASKSTVLNVHLRSINSILHGKARIQHKLYCVLVPQ